MLVLASSSSVHTQAFHQAKWQQAPCGPRQIMASIITNICGSHLPSIVMASYTSHIHQHETINYLRAFDIQIVFIPIFRCISISISTAMSVSIDIHITVCIYTYIYINVYTQYHYRHLARRAGWGVPLWSGAGSGVGVEQLLTWAIVKALCIKLCSPLTNMPGPVKPL